VAGWNWIAEAHRLQAQGTPFAIATVTAVKGSTPREPGAKMLVARDAFFGTVGGGQLEQLVIEEARTKLAEAVDGAGRYPLCFRTGQCCGGAVDVHYEIIGAGPILYLFGAGHVGQSLCQTLAGTAFQVHVIDERREWIEHPELPRGVTRHAVAPMSFLASAPFDRQRTYVAVMTHDHALDFEVIKAVIERPAKFIGLIGSHVKADRFIQRLEALGVDPDAIARIVCPMGLDVGGGKAPREIAISMAAQFLQLHAPNEPSSGASTPSS
jgi:xanthine dehydrogenase accessory factor